MTDQSSFMTAAFAEPIASAQLTAPWLEERRNLAVQAFRAKGVPHRRIEDWKYSDLKRALEASNDIEIGAIKWSVSPVVPGIELYDLAELDRAPAWVQAHLGKSASDGAMSAASLAFARSGFALRVTKDQQPSTPVSISFEGSGHARALIVAEEDARLTLVETPAAGSFSNVGIEIVVGARAHLTLVRLADKKPSSLQIEDIAVRVARDAAFHAHLVNCGAALSRLNLRITLKEHGANANLSGACVLGDALHADVTTEIYHASGQTQSVQLFKHVLGGKGRAVYQGKITVAEGANGSDSRQTAKAILLSDTAEADLKPELEILADDVKCAHGAATGDLDTDSLFYLQSRGVPEAEARNLLLRAFLEESVLPIADPALRESVWRKIETGLSNVMGAEP